MEPDLLDEDMFARNDFWSTLAWLRANAPVYRHPEPDGRGFWALTRYRDIVGVYSDHERFISGKGMRLGSDPAAVEAVAQRMLIVSDPPAHTALKRALNRAFTPAAVQALEGDVRSAVGDILDWGLEAGELDFIECAKRIPNFVVCAMMGIPRSQWEYFGEVTTQAFESTSEEERSGAHAEIFLFFTELLDERRANPGDDLVSMMALELQVSDAAGEHRRLSDEEIVFNCNGVLAGANETTRYTTAGVVLALIENPDQWQLLRESGGAAVPTAVEEALRWTTPGVHALRTAVEPATIGGHEIEPGDRVTLWNSSANRDEDVFDDPHRFKVDRRPNRHIAFGHGPHLCLGARLARLELAVFFEELLARVGRIELTADARFNASNFTWGVCSLPVRLHPTRKPAVAAG